jgi:alcohol dehydrogenase (cytochrome c)
LDRSNGEFLLAKNFVKQTWAAGHDDKGRPIVNPGHEPTPEGNTNTSPGINGGANWMSHSYSPVTKLLYVFAREDRVAFTKTGPPQLPNTAAVAAPARGGRGAAAFRRPRFPPEENWGKVIGIDPPSGTIKWEHRVLTPPWSGVTSTSGNLVLAGTLEGNVFALDARDGKLLWRFLANDRTYAAPITYLTAGGKQLISLPVGDVLITWGLE